MYTDTTVKATTRKDEARNDGTKGKDDTVGKDGLAGLILSFSTGFIILHPEEIDAAIEELLGSIARLASADRGYVLLCSPDGQTFETTHIRFAEGIGPGNAAPREAKGLYAAAKGWGTLRFPDQAGPGTTETEQQGDDALSSSLLVPLLCNNLTIGFLGFERVQEKGAWDSDVTAHIESAGRVIGNALARRKPSGAVTTQEERYRDIVENARQAMFQSTPAGRFILINPAMARICGYESAAEMSEHLDHKEGCLYADIARIRKIKSFARKAGPVEGRDVRMLRKDGTEFRAALNIRSVRSTDGRMLYYEGSFVENGRSPDMEAALRHERETFKEVLDKAPYGVVIVNSEGVCVYMNPECTAITGYALEDTGHTRWLSRPFPDPAARREAARFLMAEIREKYAAAALKVTCRDGTIKDIEFRKVFLEDGRTIVTLSDLTEKKRVLERLRESEQKFRTLFEDSNDAIYIITREGRFVDCNRSFLTLFGYTMEEVLAVNAGETFLSEEDRRAFTETIARNGSVRDYEVKLARRDRTVMDCLLTSSEKKAQDGTLVGYQGIVRNVTALKRAEETIRYMAYHDALTGLPNRVLFGDRLSMAMAQAQRSKERVAVAVLDLDQFKDVNDLFGHKAGDLILKAAAGRLSSVLRKSDTVARMGGDEFSLVLRDVPTVMDVETVAAKLANVFRKWFVVGSHRLFVTASIGLSLYPDDGEDIETLIRRADVAMYSAKRGGKNQFRRYAQGMEDTGQPAGVISQGD